jgi:hypothetical protein
MSKIWHECDCLHPLIPFQWAFQQLLRAADNRIEKPQWSMAANIASDQDSPALEGVRRRGLFLISGIGGASPMLERRRSARAIA